MATQIKTQDIEAASITGTELAAAITGTKTFSGQLIGKGTATNDSASAGYVGEYIFSYISTNTNFPTSNNLGDLTSISLTAGDWDVSLEMTTTTNGSSITEYAAGISTTSGNSATGLNTGDNYFADLFLARTGTLNNFSISTVRMSLAGTTTVYFKYYSVYTLAIPQARGRLSARRVR